MENGWESTASTLKGGGSFPLTMGIEEKVWEQWEWSQKKNLAVAPCATKWV